MSGAGQGGKAKGAAPKKPASRKAAAPAGTAGRKASPRAARSQRPGRAARTRGPAPSDVLGVLVLLATVGLAACGWMRQQEGGGAAGGGGAPTTAPVGGEVIIRFLDVGQGDAILVQSPEGKTLLIDGGRSAERMREHLKALDVSRLDLMVATHADADHIAGLVPAAALKPRVFINNGLGGSTQTWERLVAALQEAGATFTKASNQTVNLGSVKLRVVAPPPGLGDDQNENSVGIALQFGEFRALMTGDSETPATEGWLAQERDDLQGPFQVYKSIHHGAANGDSAAWLANVRPENVVISVGTPNSYGHPTRKVLDLYRQAGARVYRTDRQGTVTFRGRADGTYSAETER